MKNVSTELMSCYCLDFMGHMMYMTEGKKKKGGMGSKVLDPNFYVQCGCLLCESCVHSQYTGYEYVNSSHILLGDDTATL